MSLAKSLQALSAFAAILLTSGLVVAASAPPIAGPAFLQAALA